MQSVPKGRNCSADKGVGGTFVHVDNADVVVVSVQIAGKLTRGLKRSR